MSQSKSKIELCLASASPRRSQLLKSLRVDFFVRSAAHGVEEQVLGNSRGQESEMVAAERARVKGISVLETLEERTVVLSADTVVHLGCEILDKPEDEREARRTLKKLSGKEHGVVTALWLGTGEREFSVWRRTRVKFLDLAPETIDTYIQTGEPFDKAGGYGIQGLGGALVDGIDGCYYNVMGLPLQDTVKLLKQGGIDTIF